MSHKAGLRAEHLGLHKAICVLLGWSTVVPDDTITWVPQVLPKAEALAQKEDLILWPPVIIVHNISFSHTNPEMWKVVTMEALEAFIRGAWFFCCYIIQYNFLRNTYSLYGNIKTWITKTARIYVVTY